SPERPRSIEQSFDIPGEGYARLDRTNASKVAAAGNAGIISPRAPSAVDNVARSFLRHRDNRMLPVRFGSSGRNRAWSGGFADSRRSLWNVRAAGTRPARGHARQRPRARRQQAAMSELSPG